MTYISIQGEETTKKGYIWVYKKIQVLEKLKNKLICPFSPHSHLRSQLPQ